MRRVRVATCARASVARVVLGDADIGLEKHFGTLNGVDGRTDRCRRRRLCRGRQRNRQRALVRWSPPYPLQSAIAGRVKHHPRRSGQREGEGKIRGSVADVTLL